MDEVWVKDGVYKSRQGHLPEFTVCHVDEKGRAVAWYIVAGVLLSKVFYPTELQNTDRIA